MIIYLNRRGPRTPPVAYSLFHFSGSFRLETWQLVESSLCRFQIPRHGFQLRFLLQDLLKKGKLRFFNVICACTFQLFQSIKECWCTCPARFL